MKSLSKSWSRLARYVERDMWERDIEDLHGMRRVLITLLRLGAVVKDGFTRHELATRASALTYVTIFSLVPTLAVAFAMFSAFGGLQNAKAMLLPKIVDYLAAGVRQQVESRLDQMLNNVHGGAIGITGFLFLAASVIILLSSVEDVFNDIWGVKRSRSYFERITIYWTVVTVTPALLVLGVSLPSILSNFLPLGWMLQKTGLAQLFFSVFLPWVLVGGAFALMYWIMTSTRVPAPAAIIGGVAGGTLFFAGAHLYGWYARTTVYYSNIYGSLSAIPLFLFWVYLSWLMVLIGAEVAFATQNLSTYREELLAPDASQAARELIALRVMAEVSVLFMRKDAAPRREELPRRLHVSGRLANEVVDQLLDLGLVLEVGDPQQLVPARDPKQVSPADLIRQLRQRGEAATFREKDEITRAIENLEEQAEKAAADTWSQISFADLGDERNEEGKSGKPGPKRTARR